MSVFRYLLAILLSAVFVTIISIFTIHQLQQNAINNAIKRFADDTPSQIHLARFLAVHSDNVDLVLSYKNKAIPSLIIHSKKARKGTGTFSLTAALNPCLFSSFFLVVASRII